MYRDKESSTVEQAVQLVTKQILIFRDKLIQSTSQMREMVSELEEHLNKEPVSSK